MKMKLKINEKCIQCGSCLGCGYDFLSSNNEGAIIIDKGFLIEKDNTIFKNLNAICPVGAFELSESASKTQMLSDLISELKKLSKIEKPTQQNIKFDKNEYYVSTPYIASSRYEYSSYSAADRAAEREFERMMFSQIKVIILRIITEYRTKYIKPYYSKTVEEGSVYAKNNEKVSEILKGIKNLLGENLPQNFDQVNIFPDDDFTWKMLNKGELVSDEVATLIYDDFNYNPSDYSHLWDTDYMEVMDGKNWRGEYKFKDKYCYKDMNKACNELAKDILTQCGYAKDNIEKHALSGISWLVKQYNEKLEKLIENKIEIVQKEISLK